MNQSRLVYTYKYMYLHINALGDWSRVDDIFVKSFICSNLIQKSLFLPKLLKFVFSWLSKSFWIFWHQNWKKYVGIRWSKSRPFIDVWWKPDFHKSGSLRLLKTKCYLHVAYLRNCFNIISKIQTWSFTKFLSILIYYQLENF